MFCATALLTTRKKGSTGLLRLSPQRMETPHIFSIDGLY